MNFSKFAKKVIYMDNRNVFSQFNGNLDEIPDELKTFYQNNNPIDVEVKGVHFISVEKLKYLQKEYFYLNAEFIFATCNGDPIFLHNGHIYTCPHGEKNVQWELLACDFESYLKSLI